ncbi:hypothetical protein ALT1000_10014 [Alteromonas macleodii]
MFRTGTLDSSQKENPRKPFFEQTPCNKKGANKLPLVQQCIRAF